MSDPLVLRQHWSGSTRRGAAAPPLVSTVQQSGKPDLRVSVDPAFGGEAGAWHPPDLLGAALSTCLMVAFLDLAKRARVDVRAYDDELALYKVTEDHRSRIDRAVVRPTVTLAPGSDPDRAARVFHRAHQYCTVSNSLRTRVVLEPRFVVEGAPGSG